MITAGEITLFKNDFEKHFDLFSANSTIIVHKESKKIILNQNTNHFPGYNNPIQEFENIAVNASFPALIIYKRIADDPDSNLTEIKTAISNNICKIKVERDARDYINLGKTECVEFDEKKWIVVGGEKVQNYMGLKYYYFDLIESK